MKKVSTCILALVFAAGSSMALGGPGHGDRHHKGDRYYHAKKDYRAGPYRNVPRIEHARKHRKHAREHRRYQAAKEHRRQHRKYRKWRNHRWDHRYGHHGWGYRSWHHKPWKHKHRRYGHRYYGDYLGAALVGSALTHSLYHTHKDRVVHIHHDNGSSYHDKQDGYSEVVGCFRVEQLEDGSEVRVDLPLSECH